MSVTASFIGDHTDAAKVSIWNDVQEAIGSIHLPILNGSITPAYADYAYHYGSSAIAITFDGKVIISANDAYNAGGSAGLQFRHMDDFWVTNLNVKDMLLLDGGGSTSIVANHWKRPSIQKLCSGLFRTKKRYKYNDVIGQK